MGQIHGGSVASLANHPGLSGNVTFPSLRSTEVPPRNSLAGTATAPAVIALSVEFVAKPQEAHLVESALPAAIVRALKDVPGFAGCAVMISDQEARLATVVTFWAGEDGRQRCNQNERRVHALLAPYMDRRLRVQTLIAHFPWAPDIRPEADGAGGRSAKHDLACGQENVCVA